MLDRYNRRRQAHKDREHRSRLEEEVEQALESMGYTPSYEAERFNYVLHRKYTPDFKVGQVLIEVKGWWPPAERSKFLSVIVCNPGLPIFVALQRPYLTLSKKSKTTYAEWCSRHGIAWCPIPIPPDFMEQWAAGFRPTFHVPHRTAKAATGQALTKPESSTASSAIETSTLMEHLGSQ
jgi:hypothetical protein